MSLVETSSDQPQMIVDKITHAVKGELLDLQPQSDECCIYRVPKRLRKVDEKVYTPLVVSIGPLHYGKEELKAMEEQKRRYLQCFLLLCGTVEVSDCVKFIMEKETQLRNSYAETIELSSEEFVKMVLIDAAFIIVLMLRGARFVEYQAGDDRIFGKPGMINDIYVDLLLLENQLPFFILEVLFERSGMRECLPRRFSSDERLIKIITYCFLRKVVEEEKVWSNNYPSKVEHLLDFMRILYIPLKSHRNRTKAKTVKMRGAMELHQAGVKFKPASSENLFDIKFEDGILEIPKLEIVDDTEIVFQNLCAFEQCHCRLLPNFNYDRCINSENEQCHCTSGLFTDYITFMFGLANAPKDVEILVKKDIIVNRAYNSERVSSFFHKLDAGLMINKEIFCFSGVIEDSNKYCATTWPKWKVTLKQDYFKTRWTIISVIAGVILLGLSVIQTVCSILRVKKA